MRALWFVAGTAVGVYATAKARRAAEALTVDGVHDRLTGWFAGARVIGAELRTGAAEKESELRTRLADQTGPRALTGCDTANIDGTQKIDGTQSIEGTGAATVPVDGKGHH